MSAARPLAARIDDAYPALSPLEQRVAGFLRDRPEESALVNSAELARLTGVSTATVSRLYRRLGFADFREARAVLRAQRSTGVPVVVDDGDRLARQLAGDVANLRRLAADLDSTAVDAAGGAIAAADRVLVVGFRSAFPIAMLLRQALAQARPGVALLPEHGQSVGEEVVGLTAADVVVLVALRRRPAGFARLLSVVLATPATVVLVGEPGAPADPRIAHRFVVPIASASAFDSYVAAVSVVSALADAALMAGGDGGARVEAVANLYATLGELET